MNIPKLSTYFSVSSLYNQLSFWEVLEDLFGIGKVDASLIIGFTALLLLGLLVDLAFYKIKRKGNNSREIKTSTLI